MMVDGGDRAIYRALLLAQPHGSKTINGPIFSDLIHLKVGESEERQRMNMAELVSSGNLRTSHAGHRSKVLAGEWRVA